MPSEQPETGVIHLPPALKLPSVAVTVVDGDDAGARLEVQAGRARIGSAAGNDLCLSDRTVSRIHLELEVGPERIRLTDLDSTNGTFIDDLRVHHVELSKSCELRVGHTTLRIEVGGGRTVVVLSMKDHLGPLVGSSTAMRRMYALVERIAPSETTVLIQGETGSGKELAARTIHDLSARAEGPFVTVDCGAISEQLVESELFGHVRGAFTSASADRRGVLEEANGGTVFFDEIGELPLALQPKLLRVLDSRELRPVGSNNPRSIDVRVVAATNRPLARCVNLGTFREDLYYRLAVVELELPPLRQRPQDIPLLVRHFWERFAGDGGAPTELLATLQARDFTGNVRELRNAVERAAVMGVPPAQSAPQAAAQATHAQAADVSARVSTHLPLKQARAAWIDQFDTVYLRALLEQCEGNVTKAAEKAGIDRRTFQRRMAKLGLRQGPAER